MTKYFEMASPTYIENWPDGLARLSVSQANIRLTPKQVEAIGSLNAEYCEIFNDVTKHTLPRAEAENVFDDLESECKTILQRFPNGAIARLGSRSPKDSWMWNKNGPRIDENTVNPLVFFVDCSERINDDLLLAIREKYQPNLWIRQFLDFKEWQEWRCFQKDFQLIGVSQYHYRNVLPEATNKKDKILWAIELFHGQKFSKACHLKDVAFDVIYRENSFVAKDGIATTVSEVVLLEINPFFEMTDPCLYSWKDGGNFDGKIRVKS